MRLTYENRPLAGALVVAMNRLNPLEKVALAPTRTAACDSVWPGGMWLIKAVHMIPAPAGERRVGQLWASLTFELPTM